jgi:predicted signal transduction protein with EAL and GGDEF domain
VTLGVDQLIAGTAAHDVALALISSGLPPASLSIGIPVAAVRSHARQSRWALMQLGDLGVSSGIVGIRSWPLADGVPPSSIRWLGLDRSLVRLLAELPPPRTTVATVAAVAGAHGARTVAVGVETDRELDCIRALGVTHAQGYRFAPPTMATELGGLLARMGVAGARPRRGESTTS